MGHLSGRLPKELQEVLADYPITPRWVEPFKLVYRVAADEGLFCLKEIKYPEDEFRFIYAATEHLAANGFPRINRMMLTRGHYPFSESGGKRFFLSSWIDGREADYNHNGDVKIAAETLAQLHRGSRGFTPPPWQGRIKWGTWPENMAGKRKELIDFKEQAAQLVRKTFFDQVFLAYADDAIKQCEEALQMLVTGGYEEVNRHDAEKKYFCHHDFASHNLLIGGRGEGFVIDFDYCLVDIRCHDLASLLNRVEKRNSWDCRKAAYAFRCYDKVGNVSDREKDVIAALLCFPQDFWQMAFAFYVEKNQPLVRLEHKIRNWVLEKKQRDHSLRRLAKMI